MCGRGEVWTEVSTEDEGYKRGRRCKYTRNVRDEVAIG